MSNYPRRATGSGWSSSGTRADGVTVDVTARRNSSLRIRRWCASTGRWLFPAADGETTLDVACAGQTVQVPVVVKQAAVDRPISFKLDVMPVFMRAGCNTGSCHGAARGKDGFRLSLFGFDPDGDHFRLTREMGFRRINLAVPQESLLLEKAVGAVPHTGGKRFEPTASITRRCCAGSRPAHRTMRAKCRQVIAVELFPRRPCSKGKAPRSSSSPGRNTPTAPTAT